MRLRILALGALVLAVPVGSAEDGDEPTITDPPGDAGAGNEFGDITAVWLEASADGVNVTLELAKLETSSPGMAWILLFQLGGEACYAGAMHDVSGDGVGVVFYAGTWTESGPLNYEPIEGEAAAGVPATFSFALTTQTLETLTEKPLERDVSLSSLMAWTGVVASGYAGPVRFPPAGPGSAEFDTAEGGELQLPGAGASPATPASAESGAGQAEPGEGPRAVPFALAGAVAAVATAAFGKRR